MSKYLTKRFIFAAIYIITAALIEIISFCIMGLGAFPKYFFFDIFFIVFIAAIIFCVPYSGVCTGLLSFFLILQGIVSVVNVSFYRLYGDIFTMEVLQYAGEVGNVISFSFFNKAAFFTIFPLVLIAISLSVVLTLKMKAKIEKRRKTAILMAIVMGLSCCFSFIGYTVQKNTLTVDDNGGIIKVNDKELFSTIKNKISYLKKFGTFALYWRNFVFKVPVGGTVHNTMNDLERYFTQTDTFTKSDYFGADEGNNIVMVMLESVDTFFIHPKYTPTLYSLQESGINLTNYHSQAKTNISELSAILGNYPQNDTFITWGDEELKNAETNDFYPFALTNILRQVGYEEINYFHPSQGNNYIRNQTHTKYFGFDNAYFMEDYPSNSKYPEYEDCLYDWSMPEKWFIDSAKEEMFPKNKKFFTFLTTINAHGEYSEVGAEHTAEFRSMIDDNDFSELSGKSYYDYFKNALAEVMCVDEGIAYIVELLQKRGLSDNTTLVLYADHGAYYHELQYNIKDAWTTDSFAYNVPAFIISPSVGQMEITKFTTVFDIVPTLFQLLGIRYNTAFYYGNPVFDQNESVIISLIGGIFNDKFYSYDGVEILYRKDGATEQDLKSYQTAAVNLQEKMNKVSAFYTAEFAEALRETILGNLLNF